MTQDEQYMQRCLSLAEENLEAGNMPFAAVLTRDGGVIAESKNSHNKEGDICGHAEVNVINRALKEEEDPNPSSWTLYTNFEPCAMCSFLIRDYGIGSVVFALESPHLGGYSKWSILQDRTLQSEYISAEEATVPTIKAGVLREKAREMFDDLEWIMHKKE